MKTKVPLSVLIPGRNEQANISRCLPASRTARNLNPLLAALFLPCLIAACFFILRPSLHSERVAGLPTVLGRWINNHDSAANLVGFGVLAMLWMFIRLPQGNSRPGCKNSWLSFLEPRRRRLAVFALFGVVVEFAQFCIPGRVYDIRDVSISWLAGALAVGVWWASRFLLRVPDQTSREENVPDEGLKRSASNSVAGRSP